MGKLCKMPFRVCHNVTHQTMLLPIFWHVANVQDLEEKAVVVQFKDHIICWGFGWWVGLAVFDRWSNASTSRRLLGQWV